MADEKPIKKRKRSKQNKYLKTAIKDAKKKAREEYKKTLAELDALLKAKE